MNIFTFVKGKCHKIRLLVKGKRTKKAIDRELKNGSIGETRDKNNKEILVSLTSYPTRFSSVIYAIKSMLVQTIKPDRIILYLDDNCSDIQLPEGLLSLERIYGIEIEYRPVNMKPHKKYYYAIKENPEAYVITVDDDIIYPRNLIEELISTETRFPGCVIATRAHKVLFDNQGAILPYNDWEWESSMEYQPTKTLVATGAGGILYPPHCMSNEVFDIDTFMQLTPNNDDLWLKFIQIKSGVSVVACDQSVRKARIPMTESEKGSLNSRNVHANMNDIYVKQLMDYFKFSKKDFGY